ncbi:uncharacterized protein LOC143857963 [Tasmannia lanceolata]|uniref:uncharacterized protein LOC143857963 n=1 Tax=Tasmannia lanceolata TaxID=3420 RepID=UPI0040628515
MASRRNSSFLRERNRFPSSENSSKKRKLYEGEREENLMKESKQSRGEIVEPIYDIELHLERPLPLEWQRCLDLQSGQIHFYNTRTHQRTSTDPQQSPEPSSFKPMSLDLELNLSFESLKAHAHNNSSELSKDFKLQREENSTGIHLCSLSEASLETDREEMVTAVCMHCHMLVMLHKSSPVCPNCKFVHPITHNNPLSMFKPKFRLLCCKD